MDEMKIKSGLVFNKHSGSLVGFVDLGSVNEDIEVVLGDGTESKKKLADHAFVFMARAVFKPTLSIPIAHYFSPFYQVCFCKGFASLIYKVVHFLF